MFNKIGTDGVLGRFGDNIAWDCDTMERKLCKNQNYEYIKNNSDKFI